MNGAGYLRGVTSRLLGALLGALPAAPVGAVAPPPVDAIAFAPPAGASLPADAAFIDEHGRAVRLRDYLGARPAVVVPAYFGCSNLCGVVLRGLAAAVPSTGLQAGRDLDVIVVSIDPFDTPRAAMLEKEAVLGTSAAHAEAGWHFLTGTSENIARVATMLGYRYVYDPAERQYAHGAGLVVVAPTGRIREVLYGVDFPPATLRAALQSVRATDARPLPSSAASASAGAARRWLLCFHYDPETGRYSFAAMNAARSAGLAALLGLVGYIGVARRREHRQRQGADQ